jgi:hypothetical protein
MFETVASVYQKEIDVRQHPSKEEAAEWASFTYPDGTHGRYEDPVTIEGFDEAGGLWVYSHGKFIPNI